jgi:AAHS family 4-hydroxybenzoate transporter-like MFS transporter
MGKVGSISAPWLGGWVLSTSLPVQRTFAVFAISPALFALAIFAIGVLERRGRVHAAA